MVCREVAEETTKHLALLFSEKAVVIHFVQIAQIGKDTVSISHLLVNVVEVIEQQLSPTIEMVECLVDACL